MRGISFEKWPIIGFSIAFGLVCAVSFLSYRSIHALIDTSQDVSDTRHVIENLDEILIHTAEAESAARGYLISGDEVYLRPYHVALEASKMVLAETDSLIADMPAQQQAFVQLKLVIADKIQLHERKIALRREKGLNAALELFATGRGYQLMTDISNRISDMEAAENARLEVRERMVRQDAGRSLFMLWSGALLSLAILAAVYIHLSREIFRRQRSEAMQFQINRFYNVLSRVNEAIVRHREQDALFREVCRIAVEQGTFRMAWIGTLDQETGRVHPAAHAGREDGYLDAIEVTAKEGAAGMGPTGLAIREGRHVICDDLASDPSFLPWRNGALARNYRSSAAFPITAAGRIVGSLNLYSEEAGYFGDEIVNLLCEVTSDIGFALEAMEQESERKQAEEEARRLNEDLEQRVAARTEELGVLNQELELRNKEVVRANRLKSEFLASMSHELRTPMNAIIGFSDLMAEQKAGPLNEKQQRFLGHIQTGARHLLQLINDVLDISRIEAGRVELKPEHFSFGDAADELLSVLRPLIESKQIEVEAAMEEGVTVYADRTRFKQILYNLLSNALKFTPERGQVKIEARGGAEGTSISVADTGVGIAEEEHEAVFDMFHQAGVTTKGVREGSGLGLAITRRLVEQHGGSIRVESRVGEGTCFTFHLPRGPIS
jgi:signal transduction histidine kinase/CHASE3 domain sensor protein